MIALNEIFATEIKEARIATDTRTIGAGDFFLPIVGENFDGHNFIKDALNKGALGAFCQEESLEAVLKLIEDEKKIIPVKNTLETYHQLANSYRKKINPKVIAITGSSGKTTTKEMMRLVLSEKYKVHFTHANFNNEIGLPKTILEMPEDTEVLILEMGMRGLGEIELLSQTAEPDYALITNIGTAHIERLGSVENIQKAKMEITSGLKDGGLLVIDTELAKKIDQQQFTIKTFDKNSNFKIAGLVGAEIHSDANAVALIAQELGLSNEEIQNGLDKYHPARGRGSFHKDKSGNLFIDDSYNANPDSVRASTNALMQQFPQEHKIIVLGEILESKPELIESMHKELERLAQEGQLDFIKVEDENIEASSQEIESKLDGKSVVLVKASRKAKLERIIEKFCHQ